MSRRSYHIVVCAMEMTHPPWPRCSILQKCTSWNKLNSSIMLCKCATQRIITVFSLFKLSVLVVEWLWGDVMYSVYREEPRWGKSCSHVNAALEVCFLSPRLYFCSRAPNKNYPHAPRSTVQCAWKWLPKNISGTFFQFPWNDAIIFSPLPLISSLMKGGCLFLYRSLSRNPLLILKVFSLSFPSLCVSLSYFFLSLPGHCVYFSWCAWKRSHPPSLYPSHFLFSIPVNCFSPLPWVNPSCWIPNSSSTSHHHFLCSATSPRPICPSPPVRPSFSLCFSLAVWVCPSPNRLSHLNDGCLRHSRQLRSDSFSHSRGVK